MQAQGALCILEKLQYALNSAIEAIMSDLVFTRLGMSVGQERVLGVAQLVLCV